MIDQEKAIDIIKNFDVRLIPICGVEHLTSFVFSMGFKDSEIKPPFDGLFMVSKKDGSVKPFTPTKYSNNHLRVERPIIFND